MLEMTDVQTEVLPEALFGVDLYFAHGLLGYGCDSRVAQVFGGGGLWNAQCTVRPQE